MSLPPIDALFTLVEEVCATPPPSPLSMEDVEAAGLLLALAQPRVSMKRRMRRRVDAQQLKALLTAYNMNRHPPRRVRLALARQIGLTPARVLNWFHNRREKEKREQSSVIHLD